MSPTLDLLRCLWVTYQATLYCIIQVCSDVFVDVDPIYAYSREGLTNEKYACCLSLWEFVFEILVMKPKVELALL